MHFWKLIVSLNIEHRTRNAEVRRVFCFQHFDIRYSLFGDLRFKSRAALILLASNLAAPLLLENQAFSNDMAASEPADRSVLQPCTASARLTADKKKRTFSAEDEYPISPTRQTWPASDPSPAPISRLNVCSK
jgi:hypothetical protein